MTEEDYLAQDAVGLAALIAQGAISAREALEAALARAERVNGRMNAITLMAGEAALAAADETHAGPLAGVPFLLKDLGAQMEGLPTSAGSRLMAGQAAASDSYIVQAYKAAGLQVFGKTNTPEFGLEPVTEPDLFGPTRNPWNPEHTAGGSSGGAAAAVAAGIVPVAHASDGGGSIRIPASCCGLFGMKPSRGRVSMAPADEGWGGFSVQHVVSRSVRDSAVLLDLSSAPQPGDPYWAPPPARPFAQEVGEAPPRLRIAFTTEALAGGELHPTCITAVEQAARLCESLGHEVEPITVGWDYAPVREAAGAIVAASVAATIEAETARRGRPLAEGEVEAGTLALHHRGRQIRAADHVRALQAVHAFGRRVAMQFERFDVLLTSTLGLPPPPIGWLRGGDPRGYLERLFAFMPNTQAFNITGQPAMSVPLYWDEQGLPIGVQFVGQPAGEAMLLRLAGQLEAAQPWAGRRPSL